MPMRVNENKTYLIGAKGPAASLRHRWCLRVGELAVRERKRSLAFADRLLQDCTMVMFIAMIGHRQKINELSR